MSRPSLLSVSALLLLTACRSDPAAAPEVTISPESPGTLDELVVNAIGCEDCKFRWFRDGIRVDEVGGPTVSPDLTTKGEVWSVLATSTLADGSEGLPGEAKTTVQNSAPELTVFEVSPGEVYTDDLLVASVETSDADGDEVVLSYLWTVDGEPVGEDADSLDGLDFFDKGQEVILTVTASDGETDIQETSEAIEVLNSPPTAPVLALSGVGSEGCKSLYFDGVDDYAEAPAHADLNYPDQDYTFEMWVRFDGEDGRRTGGDLLAHRSSTGGWNLGAGTGPNRLTMTSGCCGGGPYMYFNQNDNDGWNAFDLTSGWHHIAGVYEFSKGETRLWADGKQVGVSNKFNSLRTNNSPLWFAREIINSSEFNEVKISGVRLSRTARYTNEFEPEWPLENDSSTTVLWAMDEGSGTVLHEASNSALDAAVYGGATWQDDCPAIDSVLVCSIETESVDPDGDEIDYDFSWTLNEQAYSDVETDLYDGDTALAEDLGDGDELQCEVIASDGEAFSESATVSYAVEAAPTCFSMDFTGGGGSPQNTSTVTTDFTALYGAPEATIEAWVKLDSYKTYGTLWHTGTWGVQVHGYSPAGQIGTWVQDPNVEGFGAATSQKIFGLNQWRHVATTYDNGTLSLYVDGELWASEVSSTTVLPTPTTNPRGLDIEVFYLGKEMPDTYLAGMDGLVDGLRISDTVRYTSNFTPDVEMESDQDTLLLWNFTEGSGTSVEDESANGYTGTVSNAQWSSESDCDL